MIQLNRRILSVSTVIGLLIVVFSRCIHSSSGISSNDSRGPAFAGSSSCVKCHRDIYHSSVHTAHYLSSRKATRNNIEGSFAKGKNTFIYNDSMKVLMKDSHNGLFQVAYVNGKKSDSARFNITFGSKKGQTYLYWKGDQLFELPVSYFASVDAWTTSPGYPNNGIYFDRVVSSRCLECHSSFIKKKPLQHHGLQIVEEFEKKSIIYGIDCERCHGPAARHVEFHLENPEVKEAKYIAIYKTLSRQQKLDMCAVCHSGNNQQTQRSIFYFTPGDTLSNYYFNDYYSLPDTSAPDVHGNQYQLLKASKCFVKSKTLDCVTCHDTHKNEAGSLALFSQRCMSCHHPSDHNFCPAAQKIGKTALNNCIDCHMPAKPSQAITFYQSGKNKPSAYRVRTHYIAVYPPSGNP